MGPAALCILLASLPGAAVLRQLAPVPVLSGQDKSGDTEECCILQGWERYLLQIEEVFFTPGRCFAVPELLGCSGVRTCSWHRDVGFGENSPCAFGMSSLEGSIRAPGALGEQPGMCHGKRDFSKLAAPDGVCNGGFLVGLEEPWCPARLPGVSAHLP